MIIQYISLWLICFFRSNCSVYEIYPQSETPHITQIAHLDNLDPSVNPPIYLLPDMVIWCGLNRDRDQTVFRVWDYRLNHSISFAVDVFEKNETYYHSVGIILSKALKLFYNSFICS